MLLFKNNRKSYIRSPVIPSGLTLGDFERSKSRPQLYIEWQEICALLIKYSIGCDIR